MVKIDPTSAAMSLTSLARAFTDKYRPKSKGRSGKSDTPGDDVPQSPLSSDVHVNGKSFTHVTNHCSKLHSHGGGEPMQNFSSHATRVQQPTYVHLFQIMHVMSATHSLGGMRCFHPQMIFYFDSLYFLPTDTLLLLSNTRFRFPGVHQGFASHAVPPSPLDDLRLVFAGRFGNMTSLSDSMNSTSSNSSTLSLASSSSSGSEVGSLGFVFPELVL